MLNVAHEILIRSAANLGNLPSKIYAATGHTVSWVLSGNKDTVHHNPRFDTASEHPITIYFVHGTGDYPRSFHWLMKNVIDALPPSIASVRCIAFEGRWQNTEIGNYAEQLSNKIAAYGDKKIIFIGHSRGNLVIQHALISEMESLGLKIGGIIALCPPSLGSPGASLLSFMRGSLGQMSMNSQYLSTLNRNFARILLINEIRYYPIFAQNDLLVLQRPHIDPSDPFTANSFTFPDLDHLSVMSSPEVAVYLKNTLRHLSAVTASAEQPSPLISKYLEVLKSEISRLQSTVHLLSPISKIQVLVKLMMRLESGVSEDKNASQVISEFLEDATLTSSLGLENTTPLAVLRMKLNGPNFELESRSSAVVLDLRFLRDAAYNAGASVEYTSNRP